MSWLRVFVGVGLVAQATTTMAADMPNTLPREQPLPIIEQPRARLFDVNSGWYLRGDVGYRWGTLTGANSARGFANPTSNNLDNGMFGGIGAGIKSDWLRTDVTIDYGAALKYRGTIATSGDVTAKIAPASVMFNGYLDLGTWYRATPYVGGGVGAAYMRTSEYASTVAPPFTPGLSNTQWNFAWAGMAGVGYAVSSNMMVDVGYRYINFGDVKTASDSSGSMTFKNVAAHEVRVGLRWSFDDLPVSH
jgi:opacity protein-like surface antigen